MGREGGGAPGHRRGEDAGTAAPALPPQHAASHRPAPAPTGWATAGGTRGEGRKAGRAAAQPPRRGVPAPAPPCCPRLGVAVAQETGAGPGQLAGRGAPPPGTRPVACSLPGPAPSWVPGVLTSVLRYGLRGRPWMALPLRRLPVCSTVTAAVAQEQGGGGPLVADALRVAQYCPWGWRQARLRWAAFTAPCPGCSLRFLLGCPVACYPGRSQREERSVSPTAPSDLLGSLQHVQPVSHSGVGELHSSHSKHYRWRL